MSGAIVGGGSQQVYTPQKTEGVEKKTILEKGVDLAKEKTAKGTLVGDHYVVAGALGAVGTIAGVAATIKLADDIPAIKTVVSAVTSKGSGGALSVAAAGILAEDAVKSFKDGKTVKGTAEGVIATTAGLGGTELIAKQLGATSFRPLSATTEFVGKHAQTMVGGAAAAGGAVAIKSGIDDIKDGKTGKGSAKIAAGVVGMAGGAEAIGRQFDVPYMRAALTGPAKAIFGNNGIGVGVAGAAIAVTGVAAGADGVRRMTKNKGFMNDAIGAAELTAATAGVTGGASLVGLAAKNEALAGVFKSNVEVVAAVGLGSAALAVGRHAVSDMKDKGVTLKNSAAATGAGLATLGSAQALAGNFGVEALGANRVFDKGWQPVVAGGLGLASYKFAKGAASELKGGNAVNALGQGAAAAISGGASLAIAGKAFNIPVLNTAGEKILSATGKVLEPIVSPIIKSAVEHPFATLGVVGVAAGVGAYTYYNKK